MSMMALDPGKTTGVCYSVDKKQYLRAQYDTYLGLFECLHRFKPDVIICERWDKRFRAADLDPVEVIGIVKLAAQELNAKLVFQRAAHAKDFWSNDYLKQLGLYLPAMPHAMDATRHMLYYVSFALKDKYWLDKLAVWP